MKQKRYSKIVRMQLENFQSSQLIQFFFFLKKAGWNGCSLTIFIDFFL